MGSQAYKTTPFRDVMIATLSNAGSNHVAWRHPTTYESLVKVAKSGSRISDGSVFSGNANNIKYDRGDASYHNFCSGLKYGFFGYDWSQAGGIAGHHMTKGHCGGFVAISRFGTSGPTHCVSDFGLGGSYGNNGDKPGVCSHWWGAGDTHTKDYQSVGVFVRVTPKFTKNDGDGSSKTSPAASC